MTALYQLSAEYKAAAERMADLGMDDQTVADTLEGLAGPLEERATNIAMTARNLEALAAQIKDAERQMSERRKALEARAESIRAYLLRCMTDAGVQSIESPWFALKVRQNPPSVVVHDEAAIPPEFWRTPEPPPPALDKKAIAEALKDGAAVPGCSLTRGIRLEVK